MAEDLPFKAEYAKSNRASCKACKEKIDKDSLRIARMVQVGNTDGFLCKLSWDLRYFSSDMCYNYIFTCCV